MTTVRLAIIGLGRLGRRHAANLQQTHGAQLVVACSPIAEERDWAATALPGVALYEDYAAVLANPDIDAVFLVTPTSLHAEQIIAALKAGKHVFCEKPLALNVEDCLAVEEEAARHPQLKVMIGFVRRFDASYRDAADKLVAGSGGIFMDCSIHDIDLARWLLGNPKPKRVWATGTNALHPALAEHQDVDNGVAMCEFEGGQLACFYASRTQAHGHETLTEIFASEGRLTVGANPRANRVEISDAHGVRNECVQDFYQRFADAFVTEAQVFVDTIRDNRPSPVTLADAREATRIGLAITQAFRSGEAVSL